MGNVSWTVFSSWWTLPTQTVLHKKQWYREVHSICQKQLHGTLRNDRAVEEKGVQCFGGKVTLNTSLNVYFECSHVTVVASQTVCSSMFCFGQWRWCVPGSNHCFYSFICKIYSPCWLVVSCPEQMTFAYKTTTHSSNKLVASQLPWSFGKYEKMRYLSMRKYVCIYAEIKCANRTYYSSFRDKLEF